MWTLLTIYPELFTDIKKENVFLHICKNCCNFEVPQNQCYNNVLYVQNYNKLFK